MSDPRKYTVGWIYALPTEYVAAQEFFDEEHDGPESLPTPSRNQYAQENLRHCLPEWIPRVIPSTRIQMSMIRIQSVPHDKYGEDGDHVKLC